MRSIPVPGPPSATEVPSRMGAPSLAMRSFSSPARRRCRALCHAKPLRFSTTERANGSSRPTSRARQAKTWGVIRDNVTEVIKPPPAPDQEKESWNPISRGSCSGDSTAIVCTRSRSSLSILGLGANELLALTIALPAVALEALRAHWRASSNSVSRSAWERRRPIARYRQPSTGSRSPPPRSPTRGCAP